MLPKSGNAKYPTSQPITSNTIISQIKSFIIFWFWTSVTYPGESNLVRWL